ncbi:MAG: hypothetical protein EBU90_08285 [Proteobacteria bacterium]|nr:hypothetical protein [Pseudomonadota bacterium]NBP15626.1 hypothetical protein [bacterium]
MKKYKFSTIFSNLKLRPVVSEEKDKYLSVASLEKLKKFIPNIDLENNIDLLPVAFDACVVNRVNKNGDVIDTATAVKIAKNFINKPINIEHNRNNVIGCILNYGFSEFGTSQALNEQDLFETKKPFNITLGGVIWKIVNNELAEKIEESNDPTSSNYMSISASWELGFNDFNIIVLDEGEKNIENAEIIIDNEKISELTSNLRGFGGNGKLDDKYIYRQVIGKVVPLGIGLTTNPAADVQGVATASVEENTTSQEDKINVIKERIYMKINKLEDITDALLKEVSASSVTEFIAEEIKKVNEKYLTEKAEKENALKEANEKIVTVTAEHAEIKKQVEELNQKLAALEAEKVAKAKEEAFNMRMALLDEEYDLSEEDRKVLSNDIKDLDEEAFSGYQKKISVLMNEKNKKNKAEKAKKEKVSEEVEAQEAKASEENVKEATTAQEVVETALENGGQASIQIPNSTPAAEPTLREKYAKAFGIEGFEIK